MEIYLSACNYPKSLINYGTKKALNISKDILRKPNLSMDESKNTISFITTYNNAAKNHFETANKVFKHLKNVSQLKRALRTKKFINSKRQPKNFKSILSSFKFNEINDKSVSKCGDKKY